MSSPPSTAAARAASTRGGRKKGQSAVSAWMSRVADGAARSSRVFLLGVIIACGIEVLVDWNSTLFEINVLRDAMRDRGFNYVGILVKAAAPSLQTRDVAALDVLSSGLFDDEDVVFVRFTDPEGASLFERGRETYETAFKTSHPQPFREHYAHQMERDATGILKDPEGLRERMTKSRYRDFVQAWNDAVAALIAQVVAPKPKKAERASILYQDRLRTPDRQRDADLTYALGTSFAEARPAGVVLVAFSMDRTNLAIRNKYVKGAGMVAFFVGLILVQNILSRRDKLRLLDLESRHASAKEALRNALPADDAGPIVGALDQAPGGVDGLVWDRRLDERGGELLVIDPDGEGIDAAATSLHLLKTYRERPPADRPPVADELVRLGRAALVIPLTRPVGLLLLRIEPDGAFEAVAGPVTELSIVQGGNVRALAPEGTAPAPEGTVGPMRTFRGSLPAGASIVAVCAGMGRDEASTRQMAEAASFVARAHREKGHAAEVASDLALWLRGRASGLATKDIVVALVSRPPVGTPA
jgi:hypothetical protein